MSFNAQNYEAIPFYMRVRFIQVIQTMLVLMMKNRFNKKLKSLPNFRIYAGVQIRSMNSLHDCTCVWLNGKTTPKNGV